MSSLTSTMNPKEAKAARKEEVMRLHVAMDAEVEKRASRLRQAKDDADSERLWQLITAAFEDGIVKYLGLEGKEALLMKWRSKF